MIPIGANFRRRLFATFAFSVEAAVDISATVT